MRILLLFLCGFCACYAEEILWSKDYQNTLMEKVGKEVPSLSTYPSTKYPNKDYASLLDQYPNKKVLLFGYGSLMNPGSARKSVSKNAVRSTRSVVAFGFKRIFNYKPGDLSKWGSDVEKNEGAMLNIDPKTTYNHIINGVVMEVNLKDLKALVQREIGYDLVPMLVADWNKVLSEDSSVQIEKAYTFLVPDELRGGKSYTETHSYPLRKYLYIVQEGASLFGTQFLDYWNATTYLSDGTTSIQNWDKEVSEPLHSN